MIRLLHTRITHIILHLRTSSYFHYYYYSICRFIFVSLYIVHIICRFIFVLVHLVSYLQFVGIVDSFGKSESSTTNEIIVLISCTKPIDHFTLVVHSLPRLWKILKDFVCRWRWNYCVRVTHWYFLDYRSHLLRSLFLYHLYSWREKFPNISFSNNGSCRVRCMYSLDQSFIIAQDHFSSAFTIHRVHEKFSKTSFFDDNKTIAIVFALCIWSPDHRFVFSQAYISSASVYYHEYSRIICSSMTVESSLSTYKKYNLSIIFSLRLWFVG